MSKDKEICPDRKTQKQIVQNSKVNPRTLGKASQIQNDNESEEHEQTPTAINSRLCYKAFYDLLPAYIKNPSFGVRFDLETALSRYLIVHRAVKKHYSELTMFEKVDLIHTALRFSDHFQLPYASITIPIGAWNLAGRHLSPDTFTAYLNAPDIDSYLTTFRLLFSSIPSWPTEDWATEHWLPGSSPTNRNNYFERSVRERWRKSGRWMFEYALSSALPGQFRVKNQPPSAECKVPPQPLAAPHCPGLVAFVSPSFIPSVTFIISYLDAMFQFAEDHYDMNKTGCALCLSLGAPFELDKLRRTQGFVRTLEHYPWEGMSLLPQEDSGPVELNGFPEEGTQ